MPKIQSSPLAPPLEEDRDELSDYTAKTQQSFEELFESAHDHLIRDIAPISTEGSVGDIILVNDSTGRYIAVKYADGWFKTANLVAV